jgi:hypothetical protein
VLGHPVRCRDQQPDRRIAAAAQGAGQHFAQSEQLDQLLADRPLRAPPEQRAQQRVGADLDHRLGRVEQRLQQRRAVGVHLQLRQLAEGAEPEQPEALRYLGGAVREMHQGERAPAAGEDERALEAELPQLFADGAHHLPPLGFAAEPHRRGRKQGGRPAHPRGIGHGGHPRALLLELQRGLVPDPAQSPQQRPARFAVDDQPQGPGGLAVHHQRQVCAPERGPQEAAQVEGLGRARGAAGQAQVLVDAGAAREQLAQGRFAEPARGLVAQLAPGHQGSPERRLDQLAALRAGLLTRGEQVGAQPQLREHGPADGCRVVDDPLTDLLLHRLHATKQPLAPERPVAQARPARRALTECSPPLCSAPLARARRLPWT